jgi:hypothetical protein
MNHRMFQCGELIIFLKQTLEIHKGSNFATKTLNLLIIYIYTITILLRPCKSKHYLN